MFLLRIYHDRRRISAVKIVRQLNFTESLFFIGKFSSNQNPSFSKPLGPPKWLALSEVDVGGE